MRSRGEIVAVLIALGCAAGIGVVQPKLMKPTMKVRVSEDSTSLPPAKQLKAMSFGYRTALADLLWATLIVEHGLHAQERRKWNGVTRYVDGILELEPAHPLVYKFVDTLLTLAKPGAMATADDARTARAYLERGTLERPHDQDVWLRYGQFLAFLAPSYLTDEKEIEQWRVEGARAMARAVELGADADRSLAVSTLLNNAGEKKAAIEALQRAYALSDDPETRRQILGRLSRYKGSFEAEERVSRVEYEWRAYYPFVSRSAALLIGPRRPAAACAGPQSYGLTKCPPDWTAATGEGR